MEYYYALWTSRAPDSGFNRDGVWRNGASYFTANVKTLYYMPSLFGFLTNSKSYLSHPWYMNAGRALVYTWPLNSYSLGFGDANEKSGEPNRLRLAFADFIARELGDPFASSYAKDGLNLVVQDYELRLYRMASQKEYADKPQKGLSKLRWYEDAGEVVILDNLETTAKGMAVSFRSSPFGAGSHTDADQNSFNILYNGKNVFRNSGYYINFDGPHNLMSYRHSRAHNTVLVGGIGQPYSIEANGLVEMAGSNNTVSYALGDASGAYGGISNDPMWIKAFQKANISQTPANGFGVTPLSKYRRHLVVLHPNILVIYDELESKTPTSWQWLLHGATQFGLEANKKELKLTLPEDNKVAKAQFFISQNFGMSQTDEFKVPPTSKPDARYPNQWHFTAEFDTTDKVRMLTIIQIASPSSELLVNKISDSKYKIGDWTITAALNVNNEANLSVSHQELGDQLNYGFSSVYFKGKQEQRQYSPSCLLLKDGKTIEMKSVKPSTTRVINSY